MTAIARCFRSALVTVLGVACAGSGGGDDAARADSARGEFAPSARVRAFVGPNGDSLAVSAGISADAIAGRRAAVLLRYDDRVAVYDLDRRSAVLLGGRGSGPGEMSGGMWSVAQSPGGYTAAASLIDGRVHVWTPAGQLRFTKVLVPILDAYPTVAVDDSGRAYIAKQLYDGDRRQVQLIRLGRESWDSAGSGGLEAQQAIVRHEAGGRTRRTVPSFEYVYGDAPGKLWWTVDGDGLVLLANADRYRVDTMHIGGSRGVLVERPEIRPQPVGAEERHRVLDQYTRPSLNGPPIPESQFGEMRRAVISRLFVAGDELWIGRGRTSDTSSTILFDVYGARDGRARRVVRSTVDLIGVGSGVALASQPEGDEERSLVVLEWVPDAGATRRDSIVPLITPRGTFPGHAARAATGAADEPGRQAVTARLDDLPELGCASRPPEGRGDTLAVTIQIDAGPAAARRRVRVTASATAEAKRGAVTLSVDRLSSRAACSGPALVFTLKGMLRDDLRLQVAAGLPVSVTLRDQNAPRRAVTRVVPRDGREVLVELAPR